MAYPVASKGKTKKSLFQYSPGCGLTGGGGDGEAHMPISSASTYRGHRLKGRRRGVINCVILITFGMKTNQKERGLTRTSQKVKN